MGLEDTRHISRIKIDPRDPDVVYVGAVGHLWGSNEMRGLYRTTDGGATWENILYIDEHTGVIDLVMDHNDPNTLFAATYQRQRTGFGFAAGGGGSGIWRTTDGGDSWTRLEEGLPEGELGRVGLDVYRRDGNLVYAIVEAREGQGVYRSTDRGESWEMMSDRNPRPMYFSLIRIDPNNPERIYIGGVQASASDDGGRTWWPGNATDQIHSDHHAMWINPHDSNHVIEGNDGGLSFSRDGAVTWRSIRNMAIGQFYEIDVDMKRPVQRVRGTAGQRELVRASPHAIDVGRAEPRMVARMVRGRVPQPLRPDGSQHHVLGVAGREHGAHRRGLARGAVAPPAAASDGETKRRTTSRGATGSTGTRRSRSRATTGRRSIWAGTTS